MEKEGNWTNKAKETCTRKKKKKVKTVGGSRSLDATSSGLNSPSGTSRPGLSSPTGPSLARAATAPPPHAIGLGDFHFQQPELTSPTAPSPSVRHVVPPPARNGSGLGLRVRQPQMPSRIAPYQPSLPSQSAPYQPQPFSHPARNEAMPQVRAPTFGDFTAFRTLDSFLDSENTSQAVRDRYNNMSPFERQLFDPIYRDAVFNARGAAVPETEDQEQAPPIDSNSQRMDNDSPIPQPRPAAEPSEASDRAASTVQANPTERMLITPVGKNRYPYKLFCADC